MSVSRMETRAEKILNCIRELEEQGIPFRYVIGPAAHVQDGDLIMVREEPADDQAGSHCIMEVVFSEALLTTAEQAAGMFTLLKHPAFWEGAPSLLTVRPDDKRISRIVGITLGLDGLAAREDRPGG